ncbi:alpha-(1-_3)-arabinofuranosyltransferase family protein [Blastococcus montanus]|uniref:alpha-(1->3)-arabinofuranosyltransferase domain-containing protein n=1 Tax=Blastococcus montanus TaxID=3144973 RepID=UPI0032084972
MLQQPGRTTFDTKFDLTADPASFLGRALHLWNPVSLGELQNQAYGYLFPQGPFFLAAEHVGVPDWLAQRLWSALLLVAAYEGTRRICRALGLGGGTAVLGGLAYALAPRLLGAVGVLSGEVLPEAVLPWVALPLVLALNGRLPARRAGLLSGVAVLFMSGVNATGTLAALPVAFLLAASRIRTRGGAALLGWWALGTGLACAWWLGPLLLLGRYSPPFLDFIETAATTTSPTGWANSLRGAEHWVAYHRIDGEGWWPGAHTLATSGLLAFLAMSIATFGLVGLLHRRMPLRIPLTVSLVLGLLLLTIGNSSAVGSFVDEPVRALLDGPLAPLRNVHKVDPLIRLPIALGFAHAAALAVGRLGRLLDERGESRRLPLARRVAGTSLVVVLLVSAAPLFTGGLRMPGWTEVPQAWAALADYLEDRPDSRALVVPGAGFGVHSWGWTIDEPLQGLTGTAWVTRSQVPLVPGPTARVLDAVETRLANGHGSAGLAQFLGRAGITHVVVRRDLDRTAAETAPADRVERALLDSPGLRRVAGFGSTGLPDQDLISVFTVTDAAPRVALAEARDVVTLDGGPEDVLAALDAGTLSPLQPVVVRSAAEPADLVSDGYRRVERQFGRSHDAVSEVMTGSARYREDRPTHDYPGAPTVRRAAAEHLAVDAVRASSSQGYADTFGPVLPFHGPAAAFDGRRGTAWRSAPLVPPTGQWLAVDLDRPVTGGVLQVSFLEVAGTATVQEAMISFDGESRVYGVPRGGRLVVPVPEVPVRQVRISVVSVAPGLGASSPVAIEEVEIPGTAPGRTLHVPRPIGADSSLTLRNEAPRRPCVDVGYGPRCQTSEIRETEWNGIDRRLEVVEGGTWELSGTVTAEAGAAALLAPVDDSTAAVTSTSVLGGDPSVSGAFAFDGRPETPWLADPDDSSATLHLAWSGERTLTRLAVDKAPVPAAAPLRARIESSEGVREVDLTDFGFFEPLPAPGGVSITFDRSAAPSGAGAPMGIGEVRVDGLEGLQHRPSLDSTTGAECGLGPEIRIDDVPYPTEVTGTLQDVVGGRPLTWRSCDGPVPLAPGTHRVVAEATSRFEPLSLTWRPAGGDAAATGSGDDGRLQVTSWGDTRRVVSVADGPAAVLRIAENVNDGWRATLDGDVLEPVVLDGWQQGYRIPAAVSGDVVLEFVPDPWYRGTLLAGLVLAVVLVVLAALSPRGRRRGGGVASDLTSHDRSLGAGTAAAVGVAALISGGVPLAAGWAAGLVPPVRRYATALGAVALLVSGVLAATSAGLAVGRPGVWADGTAALGLGLVLAQTVRVRRPTLDLNLSSTASYVARPLTRRFR